MNRDSSFYEGLTHEKRDRYWDAISKFYKGYGYGTIGGLIAFYYNTPNSTIEMVWGSNNGWIPLFPRRFDLKNIGPELYELDELIKEGSVINTIEKEECSIYVEGKTEELFVRTLAELNDNFGYKSVNIVSIGPFFSGSLIESLKKYSVKVFFVTDGNLDEDTGYSKSVREATKGTELTRIPNVMSYFNKDKIINADYFIKIFGKGFIEDDMSEEELCSYLENRLIKKAPAMSRANNMKVLIESCSNMDMIQDLIKSFWKEDEEKEDEGQ